MSAKNGKSDDCKYIKLFEVIDSQSKNKNYDESKVREQFKGDSFVNNLHVAKSYLYKMILKNLVQFHSENSISIQITEMFNCAMMLYKKGLYKESQMQIIKCKNFINKTTMYLGLCRVMFRRI